MPPRARAGAGRRQSRGGGARARPADGAPTSRSCAPARNSARRSAGRPTISRLSRARFLADGMQVWIVGSPNDKLAAESVIQAAGESGRYLRDLTGRTDLGTAIDLLSLASVVVSNDSGLMHAAAAVGPADGRAVRLVVAASTRRRCRRSRRSRRSTSSAAPASSANARSGHFKCMRDLAPRSVYDLARLALCPSCRRTTSPALAHRTREPPWPKPARRRSSRRRRTRRWRSTTAFEAKDVDAMMATWADDEEIVCVHPGGARMVGYDAVRAGWEQLFAGDARLSFRLDRHRRDRDGRARDAERRRAHHARQ